MQAKLIWKQNRHQLASLAELQESLEARDCEPQVNYLSTHPHTLVILVQMYIRIT